MIMGFLGWVPKKHPLRGRFKAKECIQEGVSEATAQGGAEVRPEEKGGNRVCC